MIIKCILILLGSEGIVHVAHKGQSNMPLLFTPYFGQLDQLTFFFPIKMQPRRIMRHRTRTPLSSYVSFVRSNLKFKGIAISFFKCAKLHSKIFKSSCEERRLNQFEIATRMWSA